MANGYHLALDARSRDGSILTGRDGGVVPRCYRSLLRAAELIHKTSELFTDSVDKLRISSTPPDELLESATRRKPDGVGIATLRLCAKTAGARGRPLMEAPEAGP